MPESTYGPVELYVIGYDGDRPDAGVVGALMDAMESGVIRLLDVILISKSETGEVTAIEIEDETDRYGFGSIELEATGITGDEDIDELAAYVAPGSSAALIAVELVWARALTARFAESGATLLDVERIPAPVVNALLDVTED